MIYDIVIVGGGPAGATFSRSSANDFSLAFSFASNSRIFRFSSVGAFGSERLMIPFSSR